MQPYAAIDFGTSNSALALGRGRQFALLPLENGHETLPTAVFFNADEQRTSFGRQALDEYRDAYAGRLMRSLKSLLGSELLGETTLINGKPIAYREIIATFLAHLKQRADAAAGAAIGPVVLGRPVHFVDDNAERDALAERTLAAIARDVGFSEVRFQYEPIAAALDAETQLDRETLVLVADIGGGTSDFSLVRLGPERRARLDRSDDVLASGGVHLAGTDFDQQLSLAVAMPQLGLGTGNADGKPVPVHVYFELATWHRIHFLHTPKALAEAQTLRPFFGDPLLHERLMKVLREREGHRLAAAVEDTKLAVADGGEALLALDFIERGLRTPVGADDLQRAIAAAVQKIVAAAVDTCRRAGVTPDAVEALYFTGGSTGVRALRDALAAAFPNSRALSGDRFASVARGLGVHAATLFG